MRRLTQLRDERGAVAVMVAILAPVLIGMCALAVDTSRVYQERRELQNGTDAAALAIAENCARMQNDATNLSAAAACANAMGPSTAAGSATSYVTRNANANHVPTATVDPFNAATARAVTVHANRDVSFIFAGILGEGDRTVDATSKAVWGPADNLPALPVAARDTQYLAGADTYIDLTTASQSGAFSFLDHVAGQCLSQPLHIGQTISFSAPGNRNPGTLDCSPADFQTRIVLPIYGHGSGTGNGAIYEILGFASLEVTGFHFTGGGWCWQKPGALLVPPLSCGGNQRGIWGKWVSYAAVGTPAASSSGLQSFGTIAISLVNP
jgi:Flp pilus assembly protein TadG